MCPAQDHLICLLIMYLQYVNTCFVHIVVSHPGDELCAFEAVCQQMLEDVQERLVYRTHIYIRHEILNYNPADGDLAYPEKLEMMEVLFCKIFVSRFNLCLKDIIKHIFSQ